MWFPYVLKRFKSLKKLFDIIPTSKHSNDVIMKSVRAQNRLKTHEEKVTNGQVARTSLTSTPG